MKNMRSTGEQHTCGGHIVQGEAAGVLGLLVRVCLRCHAFVYADHPCWPGLPNGERELQNREAWNRSDRASPCADPLSDAAQSLARRWERLGPAARAHVEAILTRVERAQRTAEAERAVLRVVE